MAEEPSRPFTWIAEDTRFEFVFVPPGPGLRLRVYNTKTADADVCILDAPFSKFEAELLHAMTETALKEKAAFDATRTNGDVIKLPRDDNGNGH